MTSPTTPRKRSRLVRRLIIIASILVVLALIGGGLFAYFRSRTTTAQGLPDGWTTAVAKSGSIDATVSATGNVEPHAQAVLSFQVEGTVTEILVDPGDTVAINQPLARLDPAALTFKVEQAKADLQQAQADYQKLQEGATPEEVAEAKARIAQAQQDYQKAVSSVSPADIAAARADLEKARENLARLQAGADSKDRADAEAALQQAQSALAEARSQLSHNKEQARLDMETAANSLRSKQDDYSRIYWDNRTLEGYGKLPQDKIDEETAAKRAVKDAEFALEQARIAYEDAKKQEIATLQTREADVQQAQVALDKVLAGALKEDLANARAEVARAQAQLDQLTGAERSSDLESSKTNIAIQQAALDKLLADPSASDLASSAAQVAKAEVALKEAEHDVQLATLTAPFSATVATVNLRVGQSATQGTSSESDASAGSITLTDLSSFYIEVPVDELDVAQLKDQQQVRISIDALPNAEITGTVTNIAPQATKSSEGTTTYQVRIELNKSDAPIRPGMTASVQIVTLNKPNVVLIPRRAVQTENGQTFVLIPIEGQPNGTTGAPANQHRPVTLGLSNNEQIEITSGLKVGEQVLIPDVVSTFQPTGPGGD